MADPSLLQFLPLMVTLQTSDDVLSSSLSKGVYTRAKLQKRKQRVARLRRVQSKRKAMLIIGLSVIVFRLLTLPRPRQVWCLPR